MRILHVIPRNKAIKNSFLKNMGLIYSIVIFLIHANMFVQSPDELILRGNKYYQNGQFEEAINEYNKILAQDFESASLFYNMGNSYFRSGRLGYAIYYYEKGLKLSPGDDDLTYNLRIANSRTVDKITEVPKIFIIQWWEILLTSFTTTGWSIVVILIYLIFIGSITLYLLSRKTKIQHISFFVGSISLSVLILAAVLLFSRVNRDSSINYGILTEPIYSVKVSPDSKSNDAFIIHEGIKFTIDDQVNNWAKIKLADGKVGWLPKNVFGQI